MRTDTCFVHSGLYYYLYRYYDPNLQRWMNRDPLGEPAFEGTRGNRGPALPEESNGYLFVKNEPISRWDYLGLDNPDCDIPPGIKESPAYKKNPDCFRRCCARHDKCYYWNDCTASSWGVNAVQIVSGSCGRYGKILSIGLMFHPCLRCNEDVAQCFAKCAVGLGPSRGPKWFCPHGPSAGEFFDDWDKIPPSCWEDGRKPQKPVP